MERGLHGDHPTIYRWVQRSAPELEKRCRPHLQATTDCWKVEETSLKINKTWTYLYRAVAPDGCVEVASLIDQNGVQPCHFGSLPEQLAALNRSHMSIHSLMCEALLTRNKEAARYAMLLDPLSAAVRSPAEISALFDEMWEAELEYLHQGRPKGPHPYATGCV